MWLTVPNAYWVPVPSGLELSQTRSSQFEVLVTPRPLLATFHWIVMGPPLTAGPLAVTDEVVRSAYSCGITVNGWLNTLPAVWPFCQTVLPTLVTTNSVPAALKPGANWALKLPL